MNDSEQLMDDVVTAIVGGVWVITGTIFLVGGSISISLLNMFYATLQVTIPWWILVINLFPVIPGLGGFLMLILGVKQIKGIYERRLRNIRRGL